MASSITVVGSAVYDLVFGTPRFPKPGETLLGGEFTAFPGGKGGNQAVAIARLGGQVSFVGAVGDDAFGLVLRQSLEDAGVDVSLVQVCPGEPSGCAAIVVDALGNNQIVVAPGANMKLQAEVVSKALVESSEGPVLTQLEIPLEAVAACASSGRQFILNPAPAREIEDSILSGAHLVTPNEIETESLVGVRPVDVHTCRLAARAFLEKGVQNVVITLGERGCFWMGESDEAYVTAPKVSSVDSVAAGDAFNGALALFLSQGRDWANALALANHYAALSVTKAGAQASLPTLDELEAFAGLLY